MFELINQSHDKANFDYGQVLAFYTLNSTELNNENKAIKGYPAKIPAVLIGRIGVDNTAKGQKLSSIALAHALQTAKQASDLIGIAFVVIDAKTDELARYYQKLGFVPLVGNRLVYPINQI